MNARSPGKALVDQAVDAVLYALGPLGRLPITRPPCCTVCPNYRRWLLFDAAGYAPRTGAYTSPLALRLYFGLLHPYYVGGVA